MAEGAMKGFDIIWQIVSDGVFMVFVAVATTVWATRGILDDLREADKKSAAKLVEVDEQLHSLMQLIVENNKQREQILTEKIDGLRSEVRELLVQRGHDRRVEDRGRAEGERRAL